ncbi:hypothetical protein [Novosphingobium cyanobacteriorum]|uniref:Uncharacterized protein n=1 Tax=Novosphingobium cyanobacteriorum TaxID=3024215 RepID=A0ABT6CFF5_9SPHN|nr:hypothetical protein [Novosphingobium cyanobacteriorum]MDF8332058.1 hypothetical protein [Novosphingobium cyanobacteriorum]
MSETVAAPPPRWAAITWALLILALIGLLAFAADYSNRKAARELRHLLFANSALPANGLAHCMADRFPLTRRWSAVNGNEKHIRGWNSARGVMIDIFDYPRGRRLEISTPGGRPLRDQEAEALRTCLSGR